MRRYTATPFSVIYFVVDIVLASLSLRFLFNLLGANAGHWLVRFVDVVTDPLVRPFNNMFTDVAVGVARFEWNTLAAMLAYALLSALVVRMLDMLITPLADAEEEAVHRKHRHRHHHA